MKNVRYVIWIFVLIFIGWSVILSGYNYRFDSDELYHAQKIFLIAKGFRPYADFYSVYSPILHFILLPIFLIFGFSIKTLSLARAAMIFFFAVRAVLSTALVKRVFGKKTALVFLPLLLLDPFTVFASMQIRPENLMMVFFVISLLIFSISWERGSNKYFFLSGIFAGLTILTNIKIFPGMGAFFLIFGIYVLSRKKISWFLYFTYGAILVVTAFFIYFFLVGTWQQMLQQLIIDPYSLNKTIPNPTWLGYFYFQNPVIFGLDGKPATWILAWILPVAAFAGGYKAFADAMTNKLKDKLDLLKIILFAGLVCQWTSMLFIHSVWMQYYIPLNWFYAVFGAYLIGDIMERFKGIAFLQRGFILVLVILGIFFIRGSVYSNISRAKMKDTVELAWLKTAWRIFAENEPVFPNLLFRRPVYPVIYGGTLSSYMIERYGPIYKALEAKGVKYLFMQESYIGLLDPVTQTYVRDKFKKDEKETMLWRKE